MVRLRHALRPLRVPLNMLVYPRAYVNQCRQQAGTSLHWHCATVGWRIDDPFRGKLVYALLSVCAQLHSAACQLLSDGSKSLTGTQLQNRLRSP